MNSTLSLTLSQADIDQLNARFKPYLKNSPNAYISAFYQVDGCSISVYASRKVVFQGEMAAVYAAPYQTFRIHAGSDEVGTGDYFGPVVVVAAYVDEAIYAKIKHLPIIDSKALTDVKIRSMAQTLREAVPHSLLILPNPKYNAIQKDFNLNAIKAKLHNQAYLHLRKRIKMLPELCVIDQFTPAPLYFKYLKDDKEIFRGLHFETKAESKYPAVAIASILARDAFLQTWDEMEKTFDFNFPKGGGSLVDEAAKRFVERFGKERLGEVAKLHFKNTDRL